MSENDKDGLEIPEQIREFAEKSVEQARQAFDDVMAAAQQAVSSAEESSESFQSGAASLGKQALDYAEENMASAFDFAQKIVNVSDPQEIMRMQTEYLKTQMTALGEQARGLTDTAAKTANDIGKPKK